MRGESEAAEVAAAVPQSSFEELVGDVGALIDRRRFDEAKELVERYERESTEAEHRPRFLVLRGGIEVHRGNLEAGARLIADGEAELRRRGVSGLPLAEAISAKGSISYAKHDLESALAMWTRAREMVPARTNHEKRFRGRMAYNQSLALTALGRHEDAMAAANTALSDEKAAGVPACPDQATTRAQLGYEFLQLGRYDEAVEHFGRGIVSCVGVADAERVSVSLRLGLAQARSFTGAHDEAVEQVRELRAEVDAIPDANPSAAEYRFEATMAEISILHRAGRIDEELALIARVTPRFREQYGSAHPNMVSLCLEHVMALSIAGRNAEAATSIERCRQKAAALPGGPDESAIDLLDDLAENLR